MKASPVNNKKLPLASIVCQGPYSIISIHKAIPGFIPDSKVPLASIVTPRALRIVLDSQVTSI